MDLKYGDRVYMPNRIGCKRGYVARVNKLTYKILFDDGNYGLRISKSCKIEKV